MSRTIGCYIFVVTIGAIATPASLYAQGSCTAELNRQDAAMNQFGNQTSQDVNGFVGDDAARAAFGDELVDGIKKSYERAKSILNGDPTAGAYEEFQQAWQEYQDYVSKANNIQGILSRMSSCMNSSMPVGCMEELINFNDNAGALLSKSGDLNNKWLKSLENDNIKRAAERVERAQGVVQKIAGNAGNLATSAVSGAMQNCMNDFQQRVQAANNNAPVDLGNTPQPPNTGLGARPGSGGGGGGGAEAAPASGGGEAAGGATGGGGMGAGTVGLAIAAGAAVPLYYGYQELQKNKCNVQEADAMSKGNSAVSAAQNIGFCTTQSCFNTREATFKSAVSTYLDSLGIWCSCMGSTDLDPADKVAIQEVYNGFRSIGISVGSLPSCFR